MDNQSNSQGTQGGSGQQGGQQQKMMRSGGQGGSNQGTDDGQSLSGMDAEKFDREVLEKDDDSMDSSGSGTNNQ